MLVVGDGEVSNPGGDVSIKAIRVDELDVLNGHLPSLRWGNLRHLQHLLEGFRHQPEVVESGHLLLLFFVFDLLADVEAEADQLLL